MDYTCPFIFAFDLQRKGSSSEQILPDRCSMVLLPGETLLQLLHTFSALYVPEKHPHLIQ